MSRGGAQVNQLVVAGIAMPMARFAADRLSHLKHRGETNRYGGILKSAQQHGRATQLFVTVDQSPGRESRVGQAKAR